MKPPGEFLGRAQDLLDGGARELVEAAVEDDPGMVARLDQQGAATEDAARMLRGAVDDAGADTPWRVSNARQLAFVMAFHHAFTETCDVMCPHAVDVLVMLGGARPLIADICARTCACPECAPHMPSFGFADPEECVLCGGLVGGGRKHLEVSVTVPPGVVASGLVCAACWDWAA